MAIFTVHNAYNQTLPFYLRRPVTLVDYVDEFEFGQKAEPDKAIATIEEFLVRWQSLPSVMAVMDNRVYRDLQQRGLAMRVVYQDGRQRVVIKP